MSIKIPAIILLAGALSACQQAEQTQPVSASLGEGWQLVWQDEFNGSKIDTLWWHHVNAQGTFNVLVNYWWRQAAQHLANPFDALLHSMLAIKDLPANHKANWQQLFDHYVFNDEVKLGEHTPDAVKGILGEVDELTARRVRQLLLQKLNR